MIRLSDRLQLVYSNLIPQQDVWDFCCDHGFLGGAAYKSGDFRNIYFVDPVTSIMQKLELNFKKFLFKEDSHSKAYFKTQTGETVNEAVRGTACILGVGAFVIYDILIGLATNKHLQAQRLILGPHKDSNKLLNMIKNNSLLNHYVLTSQKEVVENGRTREFFIFDLRNSNEHENF
jgi:tRNA (adenine22-N1)-methyltransferase